MKQIMTEYTQIKRNGGFDLYYECGVLLRMSKTYEISAFLRKRLNELLLRSPFKDEKNGTKNSVELKIAYHYSTAEMLLFLKRLPN